MSSIPKTIHYCWFGKSKLPIDSVRCIKSWRDKCPNYTIKRWDETNFDVSKSAFCKSAYEAGAWAFVSDYARLKVIYEHGGIYLDTDVELLRTLDSLLDLPAYFGVDQQKGLCNTGLGFGAEPFNPVVREMLEVYEHLDFRIEDKASLACPMLNHSVLVKRGYKPVNGIYDLGDASIFPSTYFDPIAPGANSKNLRTESSYSIHHYANSWNSKRDALRRQIISIIGVERVHKIKGLFNE